MNIIRNKRNVPKGIFACLVIQLYILLTILQLIFNDTKHFLGVSFIFILIVLVIFLPKDLKVFSILFIPLLYGSGIYLNQIVMRNKEYHYICKYIFLFLMVTIGITTFFLMIKVEELYKNVEEIEKKQALFTIDEVTGFENRGTLIKDLQRLMVSSKRHDYPLSIMIVELQYANELTNLYSSEEIKRIYIAIAKTINKLARVEDLKYRYDENLFMLVVPFTNKEGVEKIKERFKENLGEINIISQEKGERILRFKYKIATKEYDESIEQSIDFIKQVEKELEYDV